MFNCRHIWPICLKYTTSISIQYIFSSKLNESNLSEYLRIEIVLVNEHRTDASQHGDYVSIEQSI